MRPPRHVGALNQRLISERWANNSVNDFRRGSMQTNAIVSKIISLIFEDTLARNRSRHANSRDSISRASLSPSLHEDYSARTTLRSKIKMDSVTVYLLSVVCEDARDTFAHKDLTDMNLATEQNIYFKFPNALRKGVVCNRLYFFSYRLYPGTLS